MMLIDGEKWEGSKSRVVMLESWVLNIKKEAIIVSLKIVKSRTSGSFVQKGNMLIRKN